MSELNAELLTYDQPQLAAEGIQFEMASEAIQQYLPFLKRHAPRTPSMLLAPQIAPLDTFEFPYGSIHHYVLYDTIADGPSSTEYLYRKIASKIFMEHVVHLTATEGNPKVGTVALTPAIRAYHAKNKRFRRVDDITEITNAQMLGVVNYALASRNYRYVRSTYSDYYQWRNLQQTVWDKVGAIAANSQRAQYIFVNLPQVLPSVARLNKCAEGMNSSALHQINTHESLFILEIWKWLSIAHRQDSVFHNLSAVQLEKVQIVFQDEGRWTMLNLGQLNSWRHVSGETPDDSKIKEKPEQLQKYFLRMLMSLTDQRGKDQKATAEDELRAKIDQKSTPIEGNQVEKTGVNDVGSQRGEDAGTAMADSVGGKKKIEPQVADVAEIKDELSVNKHDQAAAVAKNLEEDLRQLEVIEERNMKDVKDNATAFTPRSTTKPATAHEFGSAADALTVFKARADLLADEGALGAAQYKRFMNLATEGVNTKNPYTAEPMAEYVKIDPALIKIDEKSTMKDMPTIVDKTMLHSSLLDFDKKYIEHVLPRDVVSMVNNTQKAGHLVTRYDVELIEDIMGASEMHTVVFTLLDGKSSTVRFKMPKVGADGVWTAGGVKYRLRKQRADLPIRKVDADLVALTTYYGKSFVSRNVRKVNNYGAWLQGQVMAKGLSSVDNSISNLAAANVFDNKFKAPRAYTSLAMQFKSFTAQGFSFVLDHNERKKLADPKTLMELEIGTRVLIAKKGNSNFLVIDDNDVLYEVAAGKEWVHDRIETFLGLGLDMPVEFSEARVFGQDLPVGFILSYLLGLDKLIEKLGVSYRTVEAGKRMSLTSNEYALVFSDESLVFEKDNKVATLILAGIGMFEKTTRKLPVHTFNKKGVYLNLLDSLKLGVRYLREIEQLNDMYVDPISAELLLSMKEPQTYQGLLVRGSELLVTDQHADLLDMTHMRIRGYERIAGAVYAELVQAIREQKAKGNRATAALEMNPFNIWKRISQDPAISIVNEINPIENLKEIEAVTFGGVGGRSSRSMVKKTRAYHPNDMGVISEATVDSGDVAINTYLSADPRFNSLRGTSDRYVIGRDGATSLVSTSALMAPGADRDDPKRTNFTSIQNSHVVSCVGYTQASVRTGYEQVLAQRVSPLFAVAAKDKGEVISRNEEGFVVRYANGKEEGFELGRRFGESRGMTIPHTLASRMEKGDKFNKGDILSYNSGFFEPDMLNPSNVVMRSGILAKTVLLESGQTLEDASSISKELSAKLTTQLTKTKDIVIEFGQTLRNMAKRGDNVEPDTVLCFIEDSVTSNAGLFDEESLNTLKLLNAAAPTAKVRGVIERIEVIYNGELEDMSDSLREIAVKSDKEIAGRARSQGKRAHSGQVLGSVRVAGTTIETDCAMVRFYITSNVSAGVGDKGVFANQMKTVFSEVLPRSMKTESGKVIDAVFGSKSVADRIVTSPDLIGTTNVLLDVIGQRMLAIYYDSK